MEGNGNVTPGNGDAPLELVERFVPLEVRQMFQKCSKPITKARFESFEGIIMDADISGFTSLGDQLRRNERRRSYSLGASPRSPSFHKTPSMNSTLASSPLNPSGSRLKRTGSRARTNTNSVMEQMQKVSFAGSGAEMLKDNMNTIFETMIECVERMGGDVHKFAGDALLVVFKIHEGEEDDTLLRSIACAFELMEGIKKVGSNPVSPLNLHIGISMGTLHALHVGGKSNRWEFAVTGPVLKSMSDAESEAKPGEIVVCKKVFSALEKIDNARQKGIDMCSMKTTKGNVLITHFTHRDDLTPEIPLRATLCDLPRETASCMRSYIPQNVLSHLDAGHGMWLSELRKVTVLFANIRDLQFDTMNSERLNKIQKSVYACQRAVYAGNGIIRQFIFDDKGCVLIAAFGVPPFSCDKQELRGLRAALEMRSALTRLNVGVSIGVTTSKCFCGIVGSNDRCEYAIVGDGVNLSARLMVKATAGQIISDTTTHEASGVNDAIDSSQMDSIYVKGRLQPVGIFDIKGVVKMTFFHPRYVKMMQREAFEEQLSSVLFAKVRSQHRCLLVTGGPGVGKTAAIERALLCTRSADMKFNVNVSCFVGNSTESHSPFYGWRPVLQSLLAFCISTEMIKKRGRPSWATPTKRKQQKKIRPALSARGQSKTLNQRRIFSGGNKAAQSGISPTLAPLPPINNNQKKSSKSNTLKNPIQARQISRFPSVHQLVKSSSQTNRHHSGPIGQNHSRGNSSGNANSSDEDEMAISDSSYLESVDSDILDETVFNLASGTMASSHSPASRMKGDQDSNSNERTDGDTSSGRAASTMKTLPKLTHSPSKPRTARLAGTLGTKGKTISFYDLKSKNGSRKDSLKSDTSAKLSNNNITTMGGANHSNASQGISTITKSHTESSDMPHNPLQSDLMQRVLKRDPMLKNALHSLKLLLPNMQLPKSYRGQKSKRTADSYADIRTLFCGLFNELCKLGLRPVVLFDNAHLLDISSVSLIASLLKRIPEMRFLMTSLPLKRDVKDETSNSSGFMSFAQKKRKLASNSIKLLRHFINSSFATHHPLQNFNKEELTELIHCRLGTPPFPEQVIKLIFEKTHGNPLFALELATDMLESGRVRIEDDNTCVECPEVALELPDSIRATTLARVDRLPPFQQLILKIGSVIGSSFHRETLEVVLEAVRPKEPIQQVARTPGNASRVRSMISLGTGFKSHLLGGGGSSHNNSEYSTAQDVPLNGDMNFSTDLLQVKKLPFTNSRIASMQGPLFKRPSTSDGNRNSRSRTSSPSGSSPMGSNKGGNKFSCRPLSPSAKVSPLSFDQTLELQQQQKQKSHTTPNPSHLIPPNVTINAINTINNSMNSAFQDDDSQPSISPSLSQHSHSTTNSTALTTRGSRPSVSSSEHELTAATVHPNSIEITTTSISNRLPLHRSHSINSARCVLPMGGNETINGKRRPLSLTSNSPTTPLQQASPPRMLESINGTSNNTPPETRKNNVQIRMLPAHLNETSSSPDKLVKSKPAFHINTTDDSQEPSTEWNPSFSHVDITSHEQTTMENIESINPDESEQERRPSRAKLGIIEKTEDLDENLDVLVRAGFLQQPDLDDDSSLVESVQTFEDRYSFISDTIMEVVYNSMLVQQRTELHRAVAEYLEMTMDENHECGECKKKNTSESDNNSSNSSVDESNGSSNCADKPQLGVHFALGDCPEKAIFYLQRAGRVALNSKAYDEALGTYRFMLDVYEGDNSRDKVRRTAVRGLLIRIGYTNALLKIRYDADEAWARIDEMNDLLTELKPSSMVFCGLIPNKRFRTFAKEVAGFQRSVLKLESGHTQPDPMMKRRTSVMVMEGAPTLIQGPVTMATTGFTKQTATDQRRLN